MGNIYLDSNFSKRKSTIIVCICVVLMLIAIMCIVIFSDSDNPKNNALVNNGTSSNVMGGENIENSEKELDKNIATTLFNFVPKMYVEEIAPFTDYFLLEAAMDKVKREQVPNYSAKHVDAVVKEIFGDNVSINKEKVSTMDVTKCIYYYYAEDDTYYTVPMGFGAVYTNQYLKNATVNNDAYYLYVYSIVGEYYIEDDGKVTVVIGDKEGKDIIKKFASYDEFMVYSEWTEDYKDKLPMYRYSLKTKENGGYYLTALEQINY